MKKEFIYKGNNEEFKAVAEEATFYKGKAVRIRILYSNGKTRNLIKFACHLEFADYEYYQNKSISELIDIAIKRINSGKFDSVLNKQPKHKLELLYRFNQSEPNQSEEIQ